MKTNICCIFNLAPHYRSPIFHLMDDELNCDFHFGNQVGGSIKLMDYEKLNGFRKILKIRQIGKTSFEWQSGVIALLFKPYKYYIITGHPNVLSNWPLLIAAKLCRKKVITWGHGMKGDPSTKYKWFERWFYRLPYKVLLYGNFSKQYMISKGFKEENLIPIYNSLDYDQQLKIRERLGPSSIYVDHFKNELPIIIHIGRIQASKKLDALIKAIDLLSKENIHCNIVFIGQDVGDNNVADLTKELGLEKNVWFYGPSYEEEEIGNLLFNADVCVSPGSVGLTAVHAMTYGLPVISHDALSSQAPEHEAIEEGRTGSFFKKDNLEDLTEKIKLWIGKSKDERNLTRQYAYDMIKTNYNAAKQIKTLKNLFNSNNDESVVGK